MKSILITGDRSGSGKTSITLALSAILARHMTVQTFKVGMDYIDPSYHTGVTGRPCRNLDSFVLSPDENNAIFNHGCEGADIALVEGVRGLFEGAEALSDRGSTADIAKLLNTNVILVVNARSITRSAAAIVKGFSSFDPDLKIRGVILNNIKGESHRKKAVTAIEHYCNIPVIGAIPRSEEMHLTMRHLGLVPYMEGRRKEEFLDRIEKVTEIIGEHISLESLLEAAHPVWPETSGFPYFSHEQEPDVTIGIAYDEAFNFYYADLFDILRSFGAEPTFFSPVHDRLPEADGYIIGGGYPELFAGELERNTAMREAIREQSRNGIPLYAECGGLLYLTDNMVHKEGWQGSDTDTAYEMCGVFSGEARMPSRRVIGYVTGTSGSESPLGSGSFRGHEFHHTDVRLAKGTKFTYQLSRGIGIVNNLDGALINRTQASYTHLHPVASRGMLNHFLEQCRKSP
jgi:cobyrinic acid a,c-diamide synthase